MLQEAVNYLKSNADRFDATALAKVCRVPLVGICLYVQQLSRFTMATACGWQLAWQADILKSLGLHQPNKLMRCVHARACLRTRAHRRIHTRAHACTTGRHTCKAGSTHHTRGSTPRCMQCNPLIFTSCNEVLKSAADEGSPCAICFAAHHTDAVVLWPMRLPGRGPDGDHAQCG